MVNRLLELRQPQTRSAGTSVRERTRRGWRWHAVDLCSGLNLAGIVAVWLTFWWVSERWWLSTALVFMPRSPYIVPAILLLGWSVFARRLPAALANLAAIVLVVGPIMGLQGNPARLLTPPHADVYDLCIVSCNVQTFRPNFALVLEEIARIDPDVVTFQEAFTDPEQLQDYFRDWHVVHVNEFYVASKYPVTLLGTCHCAAFDRITAAKFEIHAPCGKVQLTSVHPTSARHGLLGLRPWSMLNGSGVRRVERHALLRDEEARATREFATDGDFDTPALIVGDFNMPCDSCLFQEHWGDLNDAFREGGWGYGYTSPCNTSVHWPNNCPWLQVDHILTSTHWESLDCWVGKSGGSDHRLIAARLRLRGAPHGALGGQ